MILNTFGAPSAGTVIKSKKKKSRQGCHGNGLAEGELKFNVDGAVNDCPGKLK